MGYVVTKQGTLGENFHRIVDEELSSAIQILRRPGKDAEVAIHTVRKRIKKNSGDMATGAERIRERVVSAGKHSLP